MLTKLLIGLLIGISFSITIATPSHAWVGYHKPEFKGKVIDAETKEPIEGAVVVAIYSKKAIRMAPESVSIIINVKETLTDKDGNFLIPSYTTIIDPLAWSEPVTFIIFKPGYGSFPHGRVNPPMGMIDIDFEEFFSGAVGGEKEVLVTADPWKIGAESKKEKVAFGVVELPMLRTKEERERALSIANLPLESPCDKIKNLVSLLREEHISLGYKNYEHWMENCK